MSNAVALQVENMNLADAMGFSVQGGASAPSLARLQLVHGAITKEVEDEEKITVPVGAFKFISGDDVVYSKGVSMRLFAERQQWQRWDADQGTMQKSLMSNNLNADLKDTLGTFNLGRPSGYIKDFQALPEAQKEVIRSVNRVKIYMGEIKLNKAINEDGEALEGYSDWTPFVFDVKNRDTMKSMDAVVGKIMGKRISPIEYTISLTGKRNKLPSGGSFATAEATLGERTGFTESDQETLNDFLDYVERSNDYVRSKWDESNVESISGEDAAIVADFVEVKDFE